MVQVLANLVSNSLRYTPSGGIITLGAHHEADGVALTVADTGQGIAPESLPRIFDRFYRADSARSQNGDESGLGLAIVKSIVTNHGGTISVASELGKGSVFSIHLPAAS
jgi:two-component system sensor histidine kinase BaeS